VDYSEATMAAILGSIRIPQLLQRVAARELRTDTPHLIQPTAMELVADLVVVQQNVLLTAMSMLVVAQRKLFQQVRT
jgi:hypothetical protein